MEMDVVCDGDAELHAALLPAHVCLLPCYLWMPLMADFGEDDGGFCSLICRIQRKETPTARYRWGPKPVVKAAAMTDAEEDDATCCFPGDDVTDSMQLLQDLDRDITAMLFIELDFPISRHRSRISPAALMGKMEH
ncbi:hypothetical protein ACLOJK_034819 [Asimina triloba]